MLFLQSATSKDATSHDHTLFSGKFIVASAEKILYKKQNAAQYFIKFKLTNKTDKTIGVYLDYEHDAFYPHQYGIHDTSFQSNEKELRLSCEFKQHRDSISKKIISSYQSKKLTLIAPKQSIDYFVPMEIHVEDHKFTKSEYLIITCDGHIFSTDGKSMEHDCFITKKVKHAQRDLVFGHPVNYGNLPEGAFVINAH